MAKPRTSTHHEQLRCIKTLITQTTNVTGNKTLPAFIASLTTVLVKANRANTIKLCSAKEMDSKIICVKKLGLGTTTIATSNIEETIDGVATYSLLTAFSSVMLQSDGSNWYIISKIL